MRENQIMVMIKRPGEPAEVEPLFDNTLEAFQAAVDGYIEAVTLTPQIVILCNEEGKIKGLPYNVTIGREHFAGTIIFCWRQRRRLRIAESNSNSLYQIAAGGIIDVDAA